MVNFNQLCSLQSPRNILTDVSFQCKGVTKLHARDEDLKNRSDVLDTDDLIMLSNESKKIHFGFCFLYHDDSGYMLRSITIF